MGDIECTFGATVNCSEGECGSLRRVIIDPTARSVTHLVVEAAHPKGMARLVPVDLVDVGVSPLRIRCSRNEFANLEAAVETTDLPAVIENFVQRGSDGNLQVMSAPVMRGLGRTHETVSHDRVPEGKIQVRADDPVRAVDGLIGTVRALVVDGAGFQITQINLVEGRLWRKKTFAIPMNSVTGLDNGIRINLTQDQVRNMPGPNPDR